MVPSASYLAELMHVVPELMVAYNSKRPLRSSGSTAFVLGSSIYRAVWNHAARERGLGTSMIQQIGSYLAWDITIDHLMVVDATALR